MADASDRWMVRETGPVTGLAQWSQRVAAPRATLVTVHGGLDRGRSFVRVARRLADWDVVTYDRRGYQSSRSLGVGRFEEHVHDLRRIIEHEREHHDVPIITLGHSFGGVVALGALAATSGLVAGTVLYEAPLPWILRRGDHRTIPATASARAAEEFFKHVVSPAAWERLSDAERLSRQLDGPALVGDLRVLEEPAPFDVTALDEDVTYAYGHWERTPYYRELGARMATLTDAVRFVEVDGARHDAHLRRPDALAALARQVLEDACASA
ncbi:MAG: alpha/beta hydrolase [Acidimicrobiales bacterium]